MNPKVKNMYCLTNFVDNTDAINEPLRHSNRIKYTCFDGSENYYVFGATSGSLYLFNRSVCKFLHLIPNKYGSVTHVSISSNENYVAFTTEKGHVCIYVINLSVNSSPQVVTTNLLSDTKVTCIHWSQNCKQFYYGDKKGQVNLVLLNTFMGRTLLNLSVHPILFLESSIVQIDDFESLLLVSNYAKCILCNTEIEEYKQIGNRPRDGDFGACFVISDNENLTSSRMFCSRPGSRLWEIDFDGNVIQTHQFKQALACPPTKIQKPDLFTNTTVLKYEENDEIIDFQPQSLTFPKLQMILRDFIVTFTEHGLYIFDIRSSTVVLWCHQFESIANLCVINDEICVFTQTGSLFNVRLQPLHSYALELISKEKLLDCSYFLKGNLKYFSDKVKEDYELIALNRIKNFLIDKAQFEMLNDLSVIFDAIAINDDEDSSQSSGENCRENTSLNNVKKRNKADIGGKGLYVLENSFCDNLRVKMPSDKEKIFKDALLTVTGKFGKKFIKYKFNIFSDDQKSLVTDLIPNTRPNLPFDDISNQFDNDEEIVCKKQTKKAIIQQQRLISDEEKTIYKLFLICRSSQISNTNFVDRYRQMFDEYTSCEIIRILHKLEMVMIENQDTPIKAKKNCYEMYFNYLNPELIWEVDEVSRKFIADGFILINSDRDIVRCDDCNYPIRYENSCQYHELGETLLKYLWSRGEKQKCFEILNDVPALFDVLCRFYAAESEIEKIICIVLNFGCMSLLEEMGRYFDYQAWDKCFNMFVSLQQGRLSCINCKKITTVENVNRNFFYTWNCFANISLQFLEPSKILDMIFKYSQLIPNDAIDREFYTKCLIN